MEKNYVATPAQYPIRTAKQSTFKKTKEEKEMLETIKFLNKKARQQAFGANAKKHLNIPEKSIGNKIVKQF